MCVKKNLRVERHVREFVQVAEIQPQFSPELLDGF